MYEVFLFVHSWFRWIVVVAGLRLLAIVLYGWIKKKNWDRSDQKALSLFNEVLSYQIAMGICLYGFLSPLPKIGWSDMNLALHDPILRFWTIEHITSMLSSIATFHVGRMIALKKSPIEKRFKVLSITLLLSMALILSAIPWPFLKYGRDLFRFIF
ncbi:hypothetical protein [Bacteriovorax stolpii]|uniref:hypothetical protein n=1 Tax=Bacteriovorax stolpii TaxID=960 RepID=UPI00115A99A1|nr:hypothetical protein [Bacteriovorax stolpii]